MIVSDIAGGFGISQEGQKFAIEGDRVQFSCFANNLNYESPQMYCMSENNHILLTNRTGMGLYEYRYVRYEEENSNWGDAGRNEFILFISSLYTKGAMCQTSHESSLI